MRPAIVLIAACALATAIVDFGLSTFPLLREQSRLREQIAERQDQDRHRLKAQGVPPTADTLRGLHAAADRARSTYDTGHRHWFANADSALDYLVDPEARPLEESPRALRDRVGSLLLSLRPEFEGRTGLPNAPLGIDFPTTTTEVSADAVTLRDQAERGVLLRWFLQCLPEEAAIDVIVLQIERRPDTALTVRVELLAASPDALGFLHRFLEQSPDIAPRTLESYTLHPAPAAEWGPGSSRFATPPLRLSMRCSLDSPSRKRSSPAEDGEAHP